MTTPVKATEKSLLLMLTTTLMSVDMKAAKQGLGGIRSHDSTVFSRFIKWRTRFHKKDGIFSLSRAWDKEKI